MKKINFLIYSKIALLIHSLIIAVVSWPIILFLIFSSVSEKCKSYTSKDHDMRACNARTAKGYYWHKIEKKEHWPSAYGFTKHGKELTCHSGNIGTYGQAVRFGMDGHFSTVYQGYKRGNDILPDTGAKCEREDGEGGPFLQKRDYENVCGRFTFECRKIPYIDRVMYRFDKLITDRIFSVH